MDHINTEKFKNAKHLAMAHMSEDKIRTDHVNDNNISISLTGRKMQQLNAEAGIRSIAYIGNTNGAKNK